MYIYIYIYSERERYIHTYTVYLSAYIDSTPPGRRPAEALCYYSYY